MYRGTSVGDRFYDDVADGSGGLPGCYAERLGEIDLRPDPDFSAFDLNINKFFTVEPGLNLFGRDSEADVIPFAVLE